MKVTDIVVTGASGFLGQNVLQAAAHICPGAALWPVYSPRYGGVDLAAGDTLERLVNGIPVSNPKETLLIHAAAVVEWNTPAGLLKNVAIALNAATWAKSKHIGFSILVSSVSVYPHLQTVDVKTPCQPSNLYGLGKLMAEHVWQLLLLPERSAIVRLAGIWGWQLNPTLFWNRLLLSAARSSPPGEVPVLHRARSLRNYISVHDASVCLLQLGRRYLPGFFLGAGRDVVDTATFVKALQDLPDSKLIIDWKDDGGEDAFICEPSPELLPWLSPFPEELSTLWANKPEYVVRGAT